MLEYILGCFLALAISVHVFIRTAQRRKRAEQEHPKIDYHEMSADKAAPWRWRQPAKELGLTLQEDGNSSSILLPYRPTFAEIAVSAVGYFILVGFVAGLGAVIYSIVTQSEKSGDIGIMIVAFVLIAPLPFAMIRVGSRLVRVELRPTEAVLHVRYGIFLRSKTRFAPHPELTFTGKYQSIVEMTTDQNVPDYKLSVKDPYSFRRKTFQTSCDQTQGSWLATGLAEWNQQTVHS